MIKLPWLRSRKRLIVQAIINSFIFLSVYFLRFEDNVFFENKFEIFLFLFVWIIISYILGLLSTSLERLYVRNFNILQLLRDLFKNLISYFLVGSLYIIYFYLFKSFNEIKNIQNFFCFLLIVSTLSFFFRLLFKYIFSLYSPRKESWLLIADEEIFYTLKSEIEINKIDFIDLTFKTPKNISNLNLNFFNGFIISDSNLLDENLIKKLKKKFIKGIPIFKIENWCEYVLNRYPVMFLNKNFENNYFIKNINSNYMFRIKRIGDLIFGIILFIFCIPIFIIVTILIKLEDNGKVFYFQTRNGIFEKKINLIKFRTMKENAEKDSGPIWSKRNDKRITKVGKFLRLTRIDELPQLLLVIKGEMSLIGPRPERPEIDNDLKIKIPFYSERFNFKPGLSGWAQVNYPYGSSLKDSEVKLSYDLFYIRNFSLLLDFLILFKTLKLVFNAKGALPNS